MPGIGIGTPFGGGVAFDWVTYWSTRTPDNLSAVIFSTIRIDIFWDDATEASDGLKIYLSTNGGVSYTYNSTVAFGVEFKSIAGLTINTTYRIKLVAYKGSNESDAVTVDASTVNWWLSGGVSASNCKAAYHPFEAASLALSYVNQNNPGTNDAVPYNAGDQPALVATGWDFDGDSQYLKTALVPVNNQTWSMVLVYSGYTLGTVSPSGLYHGATNSFLVQLGTYLKCYNGGVGTNITAPASAVVVIAGGVEYVNGVNLGAIGAPSGVITQDIWIGALNIAGAPGQYFMGIVSLQSIYNKVLSDAEVKSIVGRINKIIYDNNKLKAIDYVEKEVSAMICWNMPTFVATEVAAGDLNPDTFAPTGYDMDNWLDALVSAGIKRAMLTVKHHDGFMLWPSDQHEATHDPYTIARTAWYAANGNPDVVEDFVNGCRARHIRPCLYFSIWDLTHELRTGTDEITDAPAYIQMIEDQLTELLTNYGDIDAIWLDGWLWNMGYEEIPFATIYNFIKGLQPNCVVIDNRGTNAGVANTTDVKTYEIPVGQTIPAGNIILAEDVDTIRVDDKWFYHAGQSVLEADYNSGATIIGQINQSIARGGCFNLGIMPTTAGVLPPFLIHVLEDLGALM